MFCRKCGTEFEGNFCPNCGCGIIRIYTPDEPEEPKPVKPDNKPVDTYIIAMIISISALLLSCLPGIGFALAVSGLVLCITTLKNKTLKRTQMIIGIVLSIIALIFNGFIIANMEVEVIETTDSESITIVSPSPEPTPEPTPDRADDDDSSLLDKFMDGFEDGLGDNYEESIDSTKEHIESIKESIKDILQ